ncbi:MAG: hypothetical protein DA330_09325 [Nitrososphaera sp.]|nr:hypothetical protein [Nitrososphaera sp.]
MLLDPNPLPYGALDYYQVHYIVETGDVDTEQFLARCEGKTKGHFSNKQVVDVKWTGIGMLVDILNKDRDLTEMLKGVLIHEGEIRIDPLDDHVRIYGKWNHEENLQINHAMVEIADMIAGHIKSMIK